MKFREDTKLTEDESLEFVAQQTTHVFGGIARNPQTLPPPTRALIGIETADVGRLMERAQVRASGMGRRLPDLQKFYARQTPSLRDFSMLEAIAATQQLLAVVETIRSNPLVEAAYIESPATPPPAPVDYTLDTGYTQQAYLSAAPEGVGSIPVWDGSIDGGAGEDMKFVDVEAGWYLTHDDIHLAETTPVIGFSKNFTDHGVAVLGIMNALDNGVGVVGIAPAAKGYISSEYIMDGTVETHSVATAIAAAAIFLMDDAPGHVVSVEAQSALVDATGMYIYLPVEAEYLNWSVITAATSCDVVIVEAAGNGYRELNTGGIAALPPETYDFLSADNDSGAIIVAAGESIVGSAPPAYRLYGSTNYGSRVDCFGRADNAYTCGVPPNPYVMFGYSSAATAIIAGVSLVTQSIARKVHGSAYIPADLRRLLRDPTQGTASVMFSGLQSMPDLMRIADTIFATK